MSLKWYITIMLAQKTEQTKNNQRTTKYWSVKATLQQRVESGVNSLHIKSQLKE